MKKLISAAVGLMALFTFLIVPPSASAASAPQLEWHINNSYKVGDSFVPNDANILTASHLPLGYWGPGYVDFDCFSYWQNFGAFGNGPTEISGDSTEFASFKFEYSQINPNGLQSILVYRPGNYTYTLNLYPSEADYNNKTNAITVGTFTCTVEEPVITDNSPSSIQTGTTIDFSTALTNVNAPNLKVSDYDNSSNWQSQLFADNSYERWYIGPGGWNTVAYRPKITVIEGSATQSSQDYTNTLNTSERITFTKAGTVKLKITYEQIPTSFADNAIPTYSPTKTITINVTDPSQPSSSNSIASSVTSQSQKTNQSSSSKSTTPASQVSSSSSSGASSSMDSLPIILADETSGIKISAENGAIPDGATVVAKAITTGEQFDKLKTALVDTAGKFTAFDISLMHGGAKIEPNGKVLVSIPIPSGYDKTKLAIFFVDDEGKITEIPSTIDGANITFETDHFSNYVVAEKSAAAVVSQAAGNSHPKGGNPMIWIAVMIIVIVLFAGAVTIWFFKFRKIKK